jgi:hypothetical protein
MDVWDETQSELLGDRKKKSTSEIDNAIVSDHSEDEGAT